MITKKKKAVDRHPAVSAVSATSSLTHLLYLFSWPLTVSIQAYSSASSFFSSTLGAGKGGGAGQGARASGGEGGEGEGGSSKREGLLGSAGEQASERHFKSIGAAS
jgi:hypothetical protein